MHAAARTYLTTGVALVGAGAIAISPVAPPIHGVTDTAAPAVATSELQLSALANPFAVYGQVVENTLANLGLLGERVIADPAPILAQILQNQWTSAQTLGSAFQSAGESLANSFSPDNPFGVPALLRTAVDEVAAGNLEGAINTLWQVVITPLLGPAVTLIPAITSVIRQPVQNLLDVIDQTQLPITLFAIGVLSPIYAGVVKAGGAFVQDVFDAVRTGDLEGLANAFITGPAAVINGFLNGDDVDAGLFSPGLGTINGLLNIRDAIAQALGRPAPTAGVAAIDSTDVDIDAARTVSVSLDAAPAGTDETGPTAEPAVAEDDSTEEEEEESPVGDEPADEPVDEPADEAPEDEAADEPAEDEDVTPAEDEEDTPAEDEGTEPADPAGESGAQDGASADAPTE
ncbi:hypothetical protein ACQI4L_06845 [Mycolicibacterium litorale]|uniref:hypothetical protein n=1 Tax=Mycolicibacterium litorale TaxID=758802 RepID=UPI003CECDFD1